LDSQLLENEQDAKDQYSNPHPLENKPTLRASNCNQHSNNNADNQSDSHLPTSKQDAADQPEPHLLDNEHNAKDQPGPHLLEDNQGPDDPQVQESFFNMKNYCATDVNCWASI
jgi:hypothetical protein